MPFRLCDGISYCPIDGSLIFLDLDQDRYFRLSQRLEEVFLAYLHGDACSPQDVSELVQWNILVPSTSREPLPATSLITIPCRSVVEENPHLHASGLLPLLEVFATVCSTQWKLKRRRLSQILAQMAAYRQRKAAGASGTYDELQRVHLEQSAAAFGDARRYVPIETSCLLDSIALVRFLARRGLLSDLIFGVTHNPFAAHCWVQADGWILNDTVGNVAAHTPIRRV